MLFVSCNPNAEETALKYKAEPSSVSFVGKIGCKFIAILVVFLFIPVICRAQTESCSVSSADSGDRGDGLSLTNGWFVFDPNWSNKNFQALNNFQYPSEMAYKFLMQSESGTGSGPTASASDSSKTRATLLGTGMGFSILGLYGVLMPIPPTGERSDVILISAGVLLAVGVTLLIITGVYY